MSLFGQMKVKAGLILRWIVMRLARFCGMTIGILFAHVSGVWRYAMLPMVFVGLGAMIGTSAGIAIGGDSHNAMIAFAVFGGLAGIVLMFFWKRTKMIKTGNGL